MSVDRWTGRLALTLQEALRDSREQFANRLGVASRTVARWQEQPDTSPRPQLQRLLDQALADASSDQRARFASITEPPSAAALSVAIAVVFKDADVLLVRRRESSAAAWQFPAGIVKPEATPQATAVRETFSETNVDCAVTATIGTRTHPRTGVYCTYLACDYLAGEARNSDPVENDSVRWANRQLVTRFIPAEQIYPPVLNLIMETT